MQLDHLSPPVAQIVMRTHAALRVHAATLRQLVGREMQMQWAPLLEFHRDVRVELSTTATASHSFMPVEPAPSAEKVMRSSKSVSEAEAREMQQRGLPWRVQPNSPKSSDVHGSKPVQVEAQAPIWRVPR